MEKLDDDWELSPETAHPDAARLLQEPFYWDVRDENSPFGNEIGAQTLELYRAALDADPELEGIDFLWELLEQWDIDREFAERVPEEELAHRLEREHFHILTYDDAVVALAFAELVFSGHASTQMGEAAIHCLQRQSLPEVLEFRGWSDPAERRERLQEMADVLQRAA